METLKKSGVDFDKLRQSSLSGSVAAASVAADNIDDEYTRDEDEIRSEYSSPGRSSRGARSPDRESTECESPSQTLAASASPSAPEYTQEYEDDDAGSSMIEEELES